MNFTFKWVLTLKIVGNAFLCVELQSLFTAFLEHNSPLSNAVAGGFGLRLWQTLNEIAVYGILCP